MKSVLLKDVLNELNLRLDKLNADTKPKWGSMNAGQMLAHCTVSFKLAFNEIEPEYNEKFIEIGKIAKSKLFDSEVFNKNIPTTKEFLKKGSEDFDKNKIIFKNYLEKVNTIGVTFHDTGKHPYFGKLSATEWGKLIYKHTNHHFVQFGI